MADDKPRTMRDLRREMTRAVHAASEANDRARAARALGEVPGELRALSEMATAMVERDRLRDEQQAATAAAVEARERRAERRERVTLTLAAVVAVSAVVQVLLKLL